MSSCNFTRSASSLAVPLLAPSDIVIVGASTAAVSAALAARRLDRSVLLVSDRSYLGEESAGALVLEPPSSGADADPLLASLVAAAHEGRLFPAAAKRVLEDALITAGVRILFVCRPVAVIRGDSDRLDGLVFAHRSSLFAVHASAILDFSSNGLVARLAGARPRPLRAPAPWVDWTVLATTAPTSVPSTPQGESFTVPGPDGPVTVRPYRLRLDLPPGDQHELIHRLRALVADPAIRQHADTPDELGIHVISPDGRLHPGVSSLPDSAFRLESALWHGGELLPLQPDAARSLREPAAQCALGYRLAAMAAAAVGAAPSSSPSLRAGSGAIGPFGFEPAFLREPVGSIDIVLPDYDDLGAWDVVVAGGGTAGAPAGIAAARAGARTLVLEAQTGLGGVGTAGLIACYWFGNRAGYTEEIDRVLRELDPERIQHARWNPDLKMAACHGLLAAAGGSAWMQSFAFGVRLCGDRVDGLLVSTPYGCGFVRAGCVIDASGSADVAAAAGAPCRLVGRDHAAVQGTGLSPRSPGRDYCNTDHTFIDDNDPEGVTHAFIVARAKFRDEFDVSTLIDSRERRQILGDLELSPLDFLSGRTFPDTVFTARSNFDTHGFPVHPVFMLNPPDKKPLDAHVPLRCMLPRGLDGVIVTGLGMSAHRDALPVIRMQADVQNQGFAAGRIAAASARMGRIALRALDIKPLQHGLVSVGILAPEVPDHTDSFPLPHSRLLEASTSDLLDARAAAVLLAHPAEAASLLEARIKDDGAGDAAAVLLGLLGRPSAAPRLLAFVRSTPWDAGWNYQGMGQFGRSLSRLDVCLIALGRTRHPEAASTLAAKIRELGADADFSHCRAIAVAAASLRDPVLIPSLCDLLRLPGVGGHAETNTAAARSDVSDNWNENRPRNLALRELYLARALLACGDEEGLGRATLEAYVRDLRGVFARHARALLREGESLDPLSIA